MKASSERHHQRLSAECGVVMCRGGMQLAGEAISSYLYTFLGIFGDGWLLFSIALNTIEYGSYTRPTEQMSDNLFTVIKTRAWVWKHEHKKRFSKCTVLNRLWIQSQPVHNKTSPPFRTLWTLLIQSVTPKITLPLTSCWEFSPFKSLHIPPSHRRQSLARHQGRMVSELRWSG